jgi:hypothetical protein
VELMRAWAPIDTADALQLLSASFTNAEVRAHAVTVLERTSQEDLLSYLLQLVQVRPINQNNQIHRRDMMMMMMMMMMIR